MQPSTHLPALLAVVATLVSAQDRMCDFPVVDGADMSPEQFREQFMDPRRPVLIRNAMKNWPAFGRWTFDNIASAFPADMPFRVGPGPYPQNEMTMGEFLTALENYDPASGEEAPGVFQYGQVPTSWTLWAHKHECVPYVSMLYPRSHPIHHNVSFACEFLETIRVPQFLVGDESYPVPPAQIAHSGLLIGGANTGIDYHKHQDAINAIVEGRKHWYMKVKSDVVDKLSDITDAAPTCTNDEKLQARRSRKMGQLAKELHTKQVTEEDEEDTVYLECIQEAGEVVYIPGYVQHGVMNTLPTIAMQMQWDNHHWDNPMSRKKLKDALLEAVEVEHVY